MVVHIPTFSLVSKELFLGLWAGKGLNPLNCTRPRLGGVVAPLQFLSGNMRRGFSSGLEQGTEILWGARDDIRIAADLSLFVLAFVSCEDGTRRWRTVFQVMLLAGRELHHWDEEACRSILCSQINRLTRMCPPILPRWEPPPNREMYPIKPATITDTRLNKLWLYVRSQFRGSERCWQTWLLISLKEVQSCPKRCHARYFHYSSVFLQVSTS